MHGDARGSSRAVHKAGGSAIMGLEARAQLRARPSEDTGRSQDTLLFSMDEWKNSRTSSGLPSPNKGALLSPASQSGARRSSDIGAVSSSEALIQLLQQSVIDAFARQGVRPAAKALAGELVAAGWQSELIAERSHAAQRLAANLPAMPFRPFILVTGYAWGTVSSEATAVRAVVDIDFRSQFELSVQGGASAAFRAALEELPEVFVGSPERLHDTVARMCQRVKREFAAKGMALPPWRSEAALLARWFPLEQRRSTQ